MSAISPLVSSVDDSINGAVVGVDVFEKRASRDFDLSDVFIGDVGLYRVVLASEVRSPVPMNVFAKVLTSDLKGEEKIKAIEHGKLEIKNLTRLRHPNICRFVAYTKNPFIIISEKFPYTLEDVIMTNTHSREERFHLVCQLASGISFIHSFGVLCPCLNPSLVFVEKNEIKIASFALVFNRQEGIPKCRIPGSEIYMAPEMLQGKGYDAKSDVFTMAVIIFRVFTGRLPVRTDEGLEFDLREDEYDCPGKPSKQFFDLLTKCCSYNPEKRETSKSFVEKLVDIAVGCVIEHSGTAKDIWKKMSDHRYCHHIPLKTFVENSPVAQEVDKVKKGLFESTLKKAALKSWNLMDITHFWNLTCWFLFFNTNTEYFKNMDDIVYSNWYARDENEVVSRLKQENHFLIRPSRKNPFLAPFCVRYVKNGVIERGTFERREDTQRHVFVYISNLFGETRYFEGLKDFVEALVRERGFIVPPPLNPFFY